MNEELKSFIDRKISESAEAMEDCGVYQFTSPRGFRYVGSTNNFRRRFREHVSAIESLTHESPGVQYEARRYGTKGWRFRILAFTTPAMRKIVEKAIIKDTSPELNDHWVKRDGKWHNTMMERLRHRVDASDFDLYTDFYWLRLAERKLGSTVNIDEWVGKTEREWAESVMDKAKCRSLNWSDFVDEFILPEIMEDLDRANAEDQYWPRTQPKYNGVLIRRNGGIERLLVKLN